MSHVATGTQEFDSNANTVAAMKAACAELGLEFHENVTTYKWFGQWVNDYHGEDAAYKHGVDPKNYGKCDHMIRLPGCAYEVGVAKLPNGKWTFIYDFYGAGRQLMQKLGKGCELLAQHTGLNKGQMLARQKGYVTQRKAVQNGDIKLVITGM